jgi:predicted NAD/FAD-dependent oxidoreductase
MAQAQRVAVIGAGMAGLACARRLADAGIAPVVFDKGRGIGGRTWVYCGGRAALPARFCRGVGVCSISV